MATHAKQSFPNVSLALVDHRLLYNLVDLSATSKLVGLAQSDKTCQSNCRVIDNQWMIAKEFRTGFVFLIGFTIPIIDNNLSQIK